MLRDLAAGCVARGLSFYVIGDASSPADVHLGGCEFYWIDRQLQTGLRTATICPQRHYARKNIGDLLAIRAGAGLIIETDDDNHSRPAFWALRVRCPIVASLTKSIVATWNPEEELAQRIRKRNTPLSEDIYEQI